MKKRFFRSRTRVGLAFALVTLITVFGLLWFVPKWLLSDSGLAWINKKLAQQGIHLQYEFSRKEASWSGFGTLYVRLDFSIFDLKSQHTSVRLENGSVQGEIALSLSGVDIIALGPIGLDKLETKIAQDTTKAQTNETPSLPVSSLIQTVSTKLDEIRISEIDTQFEGPQSSWRVKTSLHCEKPNSTLNCRLPLPVVLSKKKQRQRRLNGGLEIKLGDGNSNATLLLKSTSTKGKRPDFQFNLALNDFHTLPFTFSGKFESQKPQKTRLSFSGKVIDGDRTTLNVDGLMAPPANQRLYRKTIKLIKIQNCEGEVSDEWISLDTCTLQPTFRSTALKKPVNPKVTIVGKSNVDMSEAQFALKIPNYDKEGIRLSGDVALTISEEGKKLGLQSQSNNPFSAEFANFRTLVSALRGSPLAIPAPINTLDGPLRATIGAFNVQEGTLTAPIEATANLKSSNQSLKFQANADFGLQLASPNQMFLEGAISVEQATLQLPKLKLATTPELIPDPRIGGGPKKQKSKTQNIDSNPLRWSLRLFTSKDRRINVASNLLKSPLPLNIDIQLGSKGKPTGTFNVLPVNLELFRRKARILELRATFLKAGGEELLTELKGAIEVQYPEYTVTIRIAGTSKNPKLTFESSPPLKQQQIVALLLFGDVPTELDPEEQSSAANMDAAITQRSISLASLYLFASTPIQSVTYDPRTKSVTAKLKIGKKTTVSITGGEQKKVGLNRRIGKHWLISTEVPIDGDKTPVSSFLEWFTRY